MEMSIASRLVLISRSDDDEWKQGRKEGLNRVLSKTVAEGGRGWRLKEIKKDTR